ATAKFSEVIKQQLSLNEDGTLKSDVNTFKVDLKEELAKPIDKQTYPLYVAEQDGESFYIIPLRGAGLWDAIWGYVALDSDMNTVKGAVFDHKGETPGLGAEITQKWFQDRFVGKKIRNESGKIVGVEVVKSNPTPNDVDAISGATITSNGVSDMIAERLTHYQNYFDKLKK
ncbi:MAG: Na+-transporting NADH:ubiquinone oxidoreductase subunit C, partial [Flavobacterium sp.]